MTIAAHTANKSFKFSKDISTLFNEFSDIQLIFFIGKLSSTTKFHQAI